MSTTLRTPEQVVEFALKRIGYAMPIENLLNGTRAAQAALVIYGQERDDLLSTGEWDFNDTTADGFLLKAAPPDYLSTPWSPIYPALPWQYEYAYPADAVGIRGIKRQPVTLHNPDPRYNRFAVNNDNGLNPPQKVILCNVQNAIIVYAGQITNPNSWTPSFLEALADRLGKALGPVLKDLNATKLAAAEEGPDTTVAATTRG